MQVKKTNDDEIDLMQIFEGKDDLLDMLQRDREFYESQDRKMKLKIHALQKQFEEAQSEANKCKPFNSKSSLDKRLMEEINLGKYKP